MNAKHTPSAYRSNSKEGKKAWVGKVFRCIDPSAQIDDLKGHRQLSCTGLHENADHKDDVDVKQNQEPPLLQTAGALRGTVAEAPIRGKLLILYSTQHES